MPVFPFPRRSDRCLTTPQRYWLVLIGLVVIGLGTGAAGVATDRHRSVLLDSVSGVSGPLSVDAQNLYRALADADATAAGAFLNGRAEPLSLRRRYLDDVATITAGLRVALRDADTDADAGRLGVLVDQVPVYTGLVETARSYNRLGLPLGAAYLQEASGLMRQTLLPAARDLFVSAQGRLISAQRAAAGFPWVVLMLGVVTVVSLAAAQVWVARRTHRMVNVGLVAASLAAVLAVGWATVAVSVAADRVEVGRRDGSALVEVLANARRATLQARADEALTLIARGNGAAFERDYSAVMATLVGPGGDAGLLEQAVTRAPADDRAVIDRARGAARRWLEVHRTVRRLDDGGDYQQAVSLATDAGPDSPAVVFGMLDAAMGQALTTANARVERQADRAAGVLSGLGVGFALLTAGVVAAVVLGFRPRIREYR